MEHTLDDARAERSDRTIASWAPGAAPSAAPPKTAADAVRGDEGAVEAELHEQVDVRTRAGLHREGHRVAHDGRGVVGAERRDIVVDW